MTAGGAEIIDVGGGLVGRQALLPPVGILPAEGNGQGKGAVTNAPVAPALMAPILQVLATQQVIVGR